ncbi:hypothetical protein [Mycobacterium sp. 29Ha]|uniref:hypothetical protein n=1 Tax=Mycobacterium sp. 29Ha TaxID=2939268 RepID=UPI0029390DDD|nr:hypothetical protein [Mycobacterium sp. 29Ha]MDV3135962.1 hypothetical protein [Mycobacterium sp. 29Ha]
MQQTLRSAIPTAVLAVLETLALGDGAAKRTCASDDTVVKDGAMNACEFRDDDAGYLAWLAANPEGYVLNIPRSHSATQARVHLSGCWTISGQNRGSSLTGSYVKVCARRVDELELWATNHVGVPIPSCGACRMAEPPPGPNPTKPSRHTPGRPVAEGRYEIDGPSTGSPVVEAWADDYIYYDPERRPAWQQNLRAELRARCGQLEPSVGQVLHATFFGPKRPNADVENLVLFNIDAFKVAGRNGIRFEHGVVVPPAADGTEYPYCYRYALAPLSGNFNHWQPVRKLASFNWTELGMFSGDIKPAQVWLALARTEVYHAELVLAPHIPFAVKIEVRPPPGREPRPDLLMKGIFDGVIAAFQAHTDTAVLSDVASRLATILPAETAEIERHLLDQRRAVLGPVRQLVLPQRKGGTWNPADHLCVAGELISAKPAGPRWAIRGELVEISR